MTVAVEAPPVQTPATGSGAVNADHPWPGLAAFKEADARYFRGRESEIEELYRTVRRNRLTVVFGRSGLGKTSLLQAGLFPRERAEDGLPIYVRLDYSGQSDDLTAQLIKGTMEAAREANTEAPSAKQDDSLWEYFHRKEADFWSDDHRIAIPIVVLDQFEEFFTLGKTRHPDRSTNFIRQLADLVEGRVPVNVKERWERVEGGEDSFALKRHHYKVVLSLREDYLAELESLLEIMPSLAINRFRLRAMTGTQALKVVEEPASERNLLAPGVAGQIVRSVAGDQKGEAPLDTLDVDPAILSLFCRQLNEKRISGNASQITAELLGESKSILADFYRNSLSDLPKRGRVRRFIEDNLVTSGHRDSVALSRAEKALGEAKGAIEELVRRRLVHIDSRGGLRRLELTHDVLTGIVDQSRASRVETTRRRRIAGAIGAVGVIAVTIVGVMWLGKRRQVDRARVELETAIENLTSTSNPVLRAAIPSFVNALGPVQQILGDGAGGVGGAGPNARLFDSTTVDSLQLILDMFTPVYDSLLSERMMADSLRVALQASQDSVALTTTGLLSLQDSVARQDSALVRRDSVLASGERLSRAMRDSLRNTRVDLVRVTDSIGQLGSALAGARREAARASNLAIRPHAVDRWPGLGLTWVDDSTFGYRSLDSSTPVNAPPQLATSSAVQYPRALVDLELPPSEVTVSAVLDPSGRLDSLQVLSTDYIELNQHAIAWLEQASFTPARSAGTPIPVRIVFPVRFPDVTTVPAVTEVEDGIRIVGPSANLVVTPTYENQVRPLYPSELYQRRVSAVVVLEAVIDSTGRVVADSIHVVSIDAREGSDQFVEVTRRALERTTFRPARAEDPNRPDEGRPIPIRIQLRYVFRR